MKRSASFVAEYNDKDDEDGIEVGSVRSLSPFDRYYSD
jgi:hypothetical protein